MTAGRYSERLWSNARQEVGNNSNAAAICNHSVDSPRRPRSVCASRLSSCLPSWPTKVHQWEALCVKLLPRDRTSNWVCSIHLILSPVIQNINLSRAVKCVAVEEKSASNHAEA